MARAATTISRSALASSRVSSTQRLNGMRIVEHYVAGYADQFLDWLFDHRGLPESQRRWRFSLSARDVRPHGHPYRVAPQLSKPGGGESHAQTIDGRVVVYRSRRSSA